MIGTLPGTSNKQRWRTSIRLDPSRGSRQPHDQNGPPRILVLYGGLCETSFSRKLAHEFARLLEALDCDIHVFNPEGLPVHDPTLEGNIKVQELRALTHWSDGHVWVSPEMLGTITGVFKNPIDRIPLNTGSIRPPHKAKHASWHKSMVDHNLLML